MVLAAGIATVCGAAACLYQHLNDGQPGSYQATSALVLLLAGIAQCSLAWSSWQSKAVVSNPFRRLSFWQASLIAGAICYALALAFSGPSTGWAFIATLAAAYTALLFAFTSRSQFTSWLGAQMGHPMPRRAMRLLTGILLALFATELSLRSYDSMAESDHLAANTLASSRAAEAALVGSLPDRSAGDWSATSSAADELPFRVAIISSQSDDPNGSQSYLEILESRLPGVEVENFDISYGGPSREYDQLIDRVVKRRPHLVLATVSVGHDIPVERRQSSVFNWRELRIARIVGLNVAQSAGVQEDNLADTKPASDHQAFLKARAQQLLVCRTPIDAEMRRNWHGTLEQVERLVAGCRRRELPVALVVAPGEFQVNRVLCETLRRRMGYAPKELDLELPQRRLATFASARALPMLDLLPHLRICDESPYLRNGSSWNQQGNLAAAQAIGGWLESRYGSRIVAAAQLSSKQ